MHNSDAEALAIGARVQFAVEMSTRGQVQACAGTVTSAAALPAAAAPLLLPAATLPPAGAPAAKRRRTDGGQTDPGPYSGMIARQHDKGFGFLESDAVKQRYAHFNANGDVFVHKSEMEALSQAAVQCGMATVIGLRVTFGLNVLEGGAKLQAENIIANTAG